MFIKDLKLYIAGILLVGHAACTMAQKGQLNIDQDPKIEQLLALYNEVKSKNDYYQIQVGFGNYERAKDLKTQVAIDFPKWESKIEFEEPTYRVRVGKFKTKLEAERKYLQVRKKYPNAMLLHPEKVRKKKSKEEGK